MCSKDRLALRSKLDDCFFTSARVQPPRRHLPFIPDLHTEVLRVWKNTYSLHVHTQATSAYSKVVGMFKHGYGAMPKEEEVLADYRSPSYASSWRKPTLPPKPCRVSSNLLDKAYAAAGQAGVSLRWITLRGWVSRRFKSFTRPQILSSMRPSRWLVPLVVHWLLWSPRTFWPSCVPTHLSS